MYKLCDTKRITIGRVGESLVKQIVFDITEWFDEGLQDATYILKYVRPGETTMYQPYISIDRE